MEQQQQRKSVVPPPSSRSPSLSRRPSLKEKGSGISKSKKKVGSSVKKERWLLTRKTWRYMTDAVGNLLPEHGTSSGSKGGSGAGSRRPSSALSLTPALPDPSAQGGSWGGAAAASGSSRARADSAYWGEGGACSSSGQDFEGGAYSYEYEGGVGGGASSYEYSAGGGGAGAESPPQEGLSGDERTLAEASRGYARFVSHDVMGRTTSPKDGAGADSGRQCGQRSSIDDQNMPEFIPKLEKNFEQACNKEKKFLLWTRSRPKGLSGPALRDLKQKEKEARAAGSKKGTEEGAGLQRSSSKRLSGKDGGAPPARNYSRENLLEYYSPEEDLMDDDYDEYGEEQVSGGGGVKESRRKSSAASSILSLVSGGLSFFRPLGQTISSFTTSSSAGGSSGAGDMGVFSRIMPGGLIRYFRHAGIQTEPFPEEILIRLRLQSVQEEQQQMQQQQQQQQQQHQHQQFLIHGRYGRDSDLPVEEQQSQLHHVLIPIERGGAATSSTMAGMTSTTQGHSLVGAASRDCSRYFADSKDKDGSGSGTKSPTSPEPGADQTDKKSEESGYSSSISDTVMRYLRMARKNSKADNKETIDKFKTVNYDRSLRYIKSKNVTVEEALEHEKNKALLAQQKLEAALAGGDPQQPELPSPPLTASPPVSPPLSPPTSPPTTAKPIPPSTLAIPPAPPAVATKAAPATKTTTAKVKKASGKSSKKQTPVTSPTSPQSPQEVVVATGESTPGDTTTPVMVVGANGFPGPTLTAECSSTTDATGTPSSAKPLPLGGATSELPSSTSTATSPTGIPAPAATMTSSSQSQPGSQIGSPTAGTPTTTMWPSTSSIPVPVQQAPPPASIGIQAGESLIRFLRNFNPARKFSDFSSAASYGSSESPPVEVTSPRYSISTTVLSSNSDNEMYQQQQQLLRQEFLQHQHNNPNIPAYITGTLTGRSSLVDSSASYSGADSGDFEDQIFGAMGQHKRHSNTSSISTSSTTAFASGQPLSTQAATTTATMILKKSSSSQHIQPSSCRDPKDPALSTLYLYQIHPHPTTTPRGGLSSLSVSSTPATLSLSAPHVNVSSSLSGSAPYITASKGSPSPSASSTRSDYPQYSPRTTTITPTTTAATPSGGSSHRSSGFNFLSSFRSSTKRHSSSSHSTKPEKSHSSSSTSIGSFLRRTSSGSRKQPQQAQQPPTSSLSSSGPIPTPSVSFKTGLLGHGHGHSHGQDRDRDRDHGQGHGHSGHAQSSSSKRDSLGGLGDRGDRDRSYDRSGSKHVDSSRNVDSSGNPCPSSSSSLVMQKSKSSSSVLHQSQQQQQQHHHHGQSSGGGSSSEKRGSACSATGGGILSSQTAAAARGLMSKSRIFKSRSKSNTRAGSGAGGSCTWTPQGKCKWSSVSGKQVTVESTTVLHLSETERLTLQKVALAKLQALNLGVDVKVPREKVGATAKPKRRPYLLKKKALSTGFFDSGNKRDESKEGGGSGLVFGIPLSVCVANDQQKRGLAQSGGTGPSTAPFPGPGGGQDWEQQSGGGGGGGGAAHKRSQNGSRNSVSSVCEAPLYNKGDVKTGSTESLAWTKRESSAAFDSLSCSSGDLLGENVAPVSAAVPTIVTACIRHLETYGLHTTGIFRVSTSMKRIRQLREEIDGGKDVQFGEEQNPHDVAALLKEYLRDLPEPLLCRDLYQAFLRTQKIRNRRLQMEAVQHLIQLLPVPNRDTLAALLKFFAKVVENAADTRTRTGEVLMGNKMEAYSLATLIAPNVLPCIPTEGSTTLDQSATQTKERRESIDVINYMISNYKELFEIPAELVDEIYVHMMDTHPDLLEDILKQKGGFDDPALDELETTSSVFEGSECGDPAESEEPLMVRKFQKREEILHKDGGKGGQPDSSRSRGSKDCSGDLDKQQQSGAESDSSSTKSTSRWFRRGRSGPEHKSRTSSDSGSEKVRGKSRRESSLHETKRASSLDSVNLKETGSCPATVIVAETVVERQRSCSDQSLKVPDNMSRRQSSPVVLEGTGVITASLKIPVPVPLSIDDSDIPFIEDDGGIDSTLQARIGQFQQTTSTRPIRSRAAFTDSTTYSRNTSVSTHPGTPFSSPLRQLSSDTSSLATISQPNSPPYDDSNTFPYEELTLRFCLGPPLPMAGGGGGGGGSSSQQQSPTTGGGSKATTPLITSSSSTIYNQPAVAVSSALHHQTHRGGAKPEGSSSTTSACDPEFKDMTPVTTSEAKGLGRETKGAKIAGLIKSKTADFEKFAKDSQVGGGGPSAIASNMRLRSQGNIQLKQQFLLRQHDKFQQQGPVRSSSGVVPGTSGLRSTTTTQGPEQTTPVGSRSLQRRKNLTSGSSSAIAPSTSTNPPDGNSEKDGGKSGDDSRMTSAGPTSWKRSEIIASRHGTTPTSQPGERETFF